MLVLFIAIFTSPFLFTIYCAFRVSWFSAYMPRNILLIEGNTLWIILLLIFENKNIEGIDIIDIIKINKFNIMWILNRKILWKIKLLIIPVNPNGAENNQ